MSNATKSLSAIFITLLVITLLVKISGNPSTSEAFRSSIISVDTAAVDRITIHNPSQDRYITLSKETEGGKWLVQGSENSSGEYPADKNSIDRAINQLNNLEVKSVATRDSSKFTRFKVDSTGTFVTLYEDDEQVAGVVVGAPQILGRREFNTYIRPSNDDNVYVVEGFLGSTVNRSLNDWRDKAVWDIARENITSITFNYPADSSFSINKSDQESWLSNSDTLKNGPVNSILNNLSDLRASGFIDTMTVDNFGNELYRIELLLNNGKTRTLRLGRIDSDRNDYKAVAGDFPYVFTLSKSSWDNSVLKSRKELLK